jgi:predicted nuclease with TOPRIM domain
MIPRRYLNSEPVLTVDNRDASHAENLQDEISALRQRNRQLEKDNRTLEEDKKLLAAKVNQLSQQLNARRAVGISK